MDNRPLKFEEWEERTSQICFVSATPARLIDDFNLGWAALLIVASVFFVGLGRWVFGRGLRRYTSGSVWNSV
jgi:ABC-type uncharacterized transport system permease subunit